MNSEFFKLYIRLMKYAAFMGIIGGIASFVGAPHSGLIKVCGPWSHAAWNQTPFGP